MTNVFISSVINGFEEYRQAAKKAVELMGSRPIMSEDFGAREYSSKTACIHEVEQSDVYLLIMGDKYGFETENGLSVTQAEFRAAIAANRPTLAFIKKCEMEPKQLVFRQEVEDFQSGFFRAGFDTVDNLKDEIVKALRQRESISQAIPEDVFNVKVNAALKELEEDSFTDDPPEFVLAFLPQPDRMLDIVGMENRLDEIFHVMSKAGLTLLRDGYKALAEKDFTALQAKGLKSAYFADGLMLLKTNPTLTNDNIFSGHFAPPEKLYLIATGFQSLITETSGYVHIGLRNMGNAYVASLPDGNSMSFKMIGDKEAGFNRLFAPLTQGAYTQWVDQCIKRFSRIFKYK